MDYKVILSPLALADLEQIVRYVAAHDAAAAQRLGTRLLDQAETLCRLPHRGGRVRARPGVMKLLLRPYLIFYRVDDATRVRGLHRPRRGEERHHRADTNGIRQGHGTVVRERGLHGGSRLGANNRAKEARLLTETQVPSPTPQSNRLPRRAFQNIS